MEGISEEESPLKRNNGHPPQTEAPFIPNRITRREHVVRAAGNNGGDF
ncbi:ORF12 [Psittacine aviadenovirus B]|uniref:ORF12 n=1 Tax=psittacine adenovirus 4 TaxID=2773287 RepID=A0A1P8SW75_9ADEN|nr:ORF12 [Psittacine aviadenovirus B]APY28358.1 ORF12 [psittacine adenovirus 4]